MAATVDLRGLAVERDHGPRRLARRRPWLTRYVLPLGLMVGFMALAAWAAREWIMPPTPVTVVPVISTTAEIQQAGTPLFNAAGWIEPRPTAIRVAALAPGVVARLLVVEDQPVNKGEPLAELVSEDAQLTLDGALADLQLREAERSEAESAFKAAQTRLKQPVHLEAAVNEAEAKLAGTVTQLKNLPFELRRAESARQAARLEFQGKQAAKGVVAGVEIDLAEQRMLSSDALVEELQNRQEFLTQEQTALEQRCQALRTQLELLADEIKAKEEAEARVRAAEARVEQSRVAAAEARLRLERMTIRAPVAGRIFRLVSPPGSRVGGGMGQDPGFDGSTVVTMYRPDMLQVRVDVRFNDIPQVSLGQEVEIDNPALQRPLRGKVLFVSSEADIQKNTLQVKVEIADPPAVFKPEMLVDVTFLAPPTPDRSEEASEVHRLFIPRQLVEQAEGQSFVWVADRSAGIARRTKVELGQVDNNGLVEIKQGLTIASRIISGGRESLEEGQRIRVVGEDSVVEAGGEPPAAPRSKSSSSRSPTGGNE